MKIIKRVVLGFALLGLGLFTAFQLGWLNAGLFLGQQQARNDALIAEEMAFHTGTLAYLYGYPIVDMLSQMHNETHRVSEQQDVLAPLNRFFRFPGLVTPENSGNLRAPNADTLYFTAWYDVSDEPIVLSTPDTQGRYYTIAVTNLYAEVAHIGRRTTGTAAGHFLLASYDWTGQPPEGLVVHRVSTSRGWLLGRMYVAGPDDLSAATTLVDAMRLTPLGAWSSNVMDHPPLNAPIPTGTALEPHDSLAFFSILDRALKTLPTRPGEEALRDQFARVLTLGTEHAFNVETLDPATRRGLERALKAGADLVEAATKRTIDAYNGWMISMNIGRYGFDYLHRAAVAKGGYGNLPEESLYPAAVFDAQGHLMSGDNSYEITFPPGGLPPVDGFWSIAAYDLWTLRMMPNAIDRYTLGDRTPDLVYAPNGSLTVRLQHQMPTETDVNWLPIPRGHFMLVMRLYEPREAALTHTWVPPTITRLP